MKTLICVIVLSIASQGNGTMPEQTEIYWVEPKNSVILEVENWMEHMETKPCPACNGTGYQGN